MDLLLLITAILFFIGGILSVFGFVYQNKHIWRPGVVFFVASILIFVIRSILYS